MHELTLAQGIVSAAEEALARAGEPRARVKLVRVRVGDVAGVQAELLANAFVLARADTRLARAELGIERVPASFDCGACGEVFPRPAAGGLCPRCSARSVALRTGRELDVVALELEDDEA